MWSIKKISVMILIYSFVVCPLECAQQHSPRAKDVLIENQWEVISSQPSLRNDINNKDGLSYRAVPLERGMAAFHVNIFTDSTLFGSFLPIPQGVSVILGSLENNTLNFKVSMEGGEFYYAMSIQRDFFNPIPHGGRPYPPLHMAANKVANSFADVVGPKLKIAYNSRGN